MHSMMKVHRDSVSKGRVGTQKNERQVRLMAKGKYHEWLEPDGLLRLEAWARDGLTDEQIAGNMGIGKTTFYDWKKKFPDFANALKKNKELVDIQVENALFKRAIGYKDIVAKVKILNDGTPIPYVEEVVYPPDVTAQIFWLKNRKPAEWRDKQDVDVAVSTLPQIVFKKSGDEGE